ncbi:hypothetical protein ADUPG1_006211 [Aduncisulcus paluster]|uniref:Uncharacterized protein n=1 Tax=Aduncisulcus paluster TaxID=2918883 RepID=A0ABQ5KH83_9EUKA|nr:hypothetical protein ADUPG1_006211 [Aduncisulcus paluster]
MAIKVMNNKDTEKSERTTAMDTPKPPFLKSLDTKNWGEFTRELTHYKSLGGTKNWIEMVEASTLAVITDISDVPDLKSAENQEKAFNAVEQVFASTKAIGLYDSLSACKMERRLSIDALLRYN